LVPFFPFQLLVLAFPASFFLAELFVLPVFPLAFSFASLAFPFAFLFVYQPFAFVLPTDCLNSFERFLKPGTCCQESQEAPPIHQRSATFPLINQGVFD